MSKDNEDQVRVEQQQDRQQQRQGADAEVLGKPADEQTEWEKRQQEKLAMGAIYPENDPDNPESDNYVQRPLNAAEEAEIRMEEERAKEAPAPRDPHREGVA